LKANGVLLSRNPNVHKCPSCAAEIPEGRPYCLTCGKVPAVPAGPTYGATWMFAGIGLLAVLIYWAAMNGNTQTAAPAPSPTPVLDAAARFVQHCGKPDMDSAIPASLQPKAPERRSLLYRSARVRAVFERDAPQSSDGWKNVKYFDAASRKQLNSQQVLKRLPCVASTAPPG
jgi:hypothetical protein